MEKTIKEIHSIAKEIAFMSFKKSFSEIKEIGLHPGQKAIISAIKKNEGMSSKDLVKLSKREPATITKTLQRLELSGYVIKKVDSNDKRISRLYLTDKGRETYKKIKKFEEEQLEKFSKILDQEDIDTLYNVLIKIKTKLEGDKNEKDI